MLFFPIGFEIAFSENPMDWQVRGEFSLLGREHLNLRDYVCKTHDQVSSWINELICALKEAASRLQAVLAAEGISEDELLKDFKQWRGSKRK